MEKILICGDSFAADWTIDQQIDGWPNMLDKEFHVDNLAQAGCSQYKIYKQLTSKIKKLTEYSFVIISHTSPYRIYTTEHPCYVKDKLHKNSDFIYNDVKNKVDQFPELKCITDYYERFFDFEYAKFVHNCICEQIHNITKCCLNVIHMSGFDYKDLYEFNNFLDLSQIHTCHKGSVNHFNNQGNKMVYEKIVRKINENKH